MTAGFVLLGRIWKFTDRDDEVGGNTPSGTVVYENVPVRIQNSPNSLSLVIQGYETSKFFSAVIQPRPDMLLIEKKHYFQVTSPPNSKHYMDMFRITNIQEENFHPADPRRYLVAVFERSEIAHGNLYQ